MRPSLFVCVAISAALAIPSAPAQTDATPEAAKAAVLRRELLELMDERIEMARAGVASMATVVELQESLFRAGRATQESIDALRRPHVGAQLAVVELEIERIGLHDRLQPEATPRFEALLERTDEAIALRGTLVEASRRARDIQSALFQAGRVTALDLAQAERTLLDDRLALVAATQQRKRIELDRVEFRARPDRVK